MTRFAHAMMASLMLLICTATAYAVNITGTVQDASTNEPLIEATVRLLAAKDSAFVKGVTTNTNGRFTLSGINKGKYILAVT
ncbi:MAG: carboxypeptidase-like regulatory domain-containing protein, partial [Duncaniella sp.]|nr:carboxypeptidase-like regulatory domain-containing protein [Duncaniella sp.]